MHDDTFNPIYAYKVGVYILLMRKHFFVTSNRHSEQSFFNIFKSKPHTSLASVHAPITHFELESDLTGHFWHIVIT